MESGCGEQKLRLNPRKGWGIYLLSTRCVSILLICLFSRKSYAHPIHTLAWKAFFLFWLCTAWLVRSWFSGLSMLIRLNFLKCRLSWPDTEGCWQLPCGSNLILFSRHFGAHYLIQYSQMSCEAYPVITRYQ